jgi:hypothetical protein
MNMKEKPYYITQNGTELAYTRSQTAQGAINLLNKEHPHLVTKSLSEIAEYGYIVKKDKLK